MTTARVLGLAICLASTPALALEQGEYRLNGFGTAGLTYLGGEDDSKGYGVNGQTTDSWRGDQLSKLGGQFQYGITDTIGFTAQGTIKPAQDEWQANVEWLYLSWQASDNLMVRTGRLRTPVYMYSESIDVGFSYPWLRLPDEVYSQVQLSNYEGADVVYNLPVSFGTVSFQVAGGMAKNRDIFAVDDMHDIDYNDIFGGNISLSTNDFGTFRAGYVEADIKANIEDDVTLPFFGTINVSLNPLDHQKGKFTSFGYQYDNGTWLTANEWTSRVIEADGSGSTDAFYLMGGRRFGEFLPHVTYAQLDEDAGRQNSWTFGLNYNLMPTVVLKGEYKRVETSGDSYEGVFVRDAQQTVDDRLGLAPAHNFDGDIFSVGVDFVF
ncbi:porin [Pseudomonas sp. J452]|uniref:porin n=1 Tax=Pseudomonas sp. J452 TaxID=2898441 RepID=UPI0021AD5569|nr:porin [Pseudomonas sp. J452]UUY09790.1 porin [Pseudomonas sp. J452]